MLERGGGEKTLLVLSQVYPPDPAAVGQHMADVAKAMAARGWRVVVLTADRGYDDPAIRYPRRETRDGVLVRRLPLASFGKRSIARRLAAGASFVVQSALWGFFTRHLAVVLVSTSPPFCSLAALAVAAVRRVPIKYWVMDLNPDQMIALGRISERSLGARLFEWINRRILGRAADVVVLDWFMAERLDRKLDVSNKRTVMPPWPLEGNLEVIRHNDNPFRAEHDLQNRFVIMYSGNHGIANPITTVLEAALALQDESRLLFMFVGGGIGKREVDEAIARFRPPNVVSLPYQPLDRIKYSLSAADVHLVSMGETMVGIVHPSKVYGAMAVARPVLLLGPEPCHVSELLDQHHLGWQIRHGDVDGAITTIRTILATPRAELEEMGRRGRQVVTTELAKATLCDRFCDLVEREVA